MGCRHPQKAIAQDGQDSGFTTCANPDECNPCAHGCITTHQRCTRCGATRRVNVNQDHVEEGEWQKPMPACQVCGGSNLAKMPGGTRTLCFGCGAHQVRKPK